jgi:D-aspartate ligase
VTRRSPVAVVAAADSVTALAAIRSLGRAGVRVKVANHSAHAIGLRSRFAEHVPVPDPRRDEDGFIRALERLGAELGRRTPIFPTSDAYLNVIARHSERLEDLYSFPFPAADAVLRIQSKRHQLERAQELGIPAPRMRNGPTEELGFPVLVKPSDPVGFVDALGEKAIRCDTATELQRAFDAARDFDPIVQEWIPGGDEQLYFLGAYLSSAYAPLGMFTGRKLRQLPPGIGTTRVGESVAAPEVEDLGLRFLEGIGCYGLSDVEFKLDPRDGLFKLMEVNPRLGQWHGLATAAGVDLTAIAYRDLVGEEVRPVRQVSKTKRWAITFLSGSGHERPSLHGAGPSFTRLPYTDAVFAVDDPWPSAVQFGVLARGVLQKVKR